MMAYLPTGETVTVAWLKAALGVTNVATTLPQDTSSWANGGFYVVTPLAGGVVVSGYGARRTVVGVDAYACRPGSTRAPWGLAAQLAEAVVNVTNTAAGGGCRSVTPGTGYAAARVLCVEHAGGPRRVASQRADLARYTMDLAVHWAY